MSAPALFDKPEPVRRALSRMYSVPTYRASDTTKVRWTDVRVKAPLPCDECFAAQHETRGECGPRASAKQRRTVVGGPVLALCRAHAELWRARDENDVTS